MLFSPVEKGGVSEVSSLSAVIACFPPSIITSHVCYIIIFTIISSSVPSLCVFFKGWGVGVGGFKTLKIK